MEGKSVASNINDTISENVTSDRQSVEITPKIVRAIAEKVYKLFMHEFEIERERNSMLRK